MNLDVPFINLGQMENFILSEYADLAYNILKSNTNYSRDKQIINDIFKHERPTRFETIVLRLTIIDSYYSTQMNKRFFGIDDVAGAIEKLAISDLETIEIAKSYLSQNTNNSISHLYLDEYGIDKTGEPFGKAVSLISKYFYFLTEHKFPIYDSLAISSYKAIFGKYTSLELKKHSETEEQAFFTNIIKLNIDSKINDFDKLDNLLWLIGKMTEGSLSLILNKENYKNLVKKIEFPTKLKKKKEVSEEVRTSIDQQIRNYIFNNCKSIPEFTIEHTKFLKFCFWLKPGCFKILSDN